jgi:hypothetical protein
MVGDTESGIVSRISVLWFSIVNRWVIQIKAVRCVLINSRSTEFITMLALGAGEIYFLIEQGMGENLGLIYRFYAVFFKTASSTKV